MDNFKDSVRKIFTGAVKSFSRFPVSIISAIVISLVAFIRISMNVGVEVAYQYPVFDSIQLAFLLSAVFSMALVAYEEITLKKDRKLKHSNYAGIILAIVTSFLLIYFGQSTINNKVAQLSSIATARVIVSTLISAIAFVYIISKAKKINSFTDAFFLTHKAFIISTIYGIVLMLGIFGVIGAFQALIYNDLSFRTYQYFGIVVAFITYAIFLGNLPRFDIHEKTKTIEIAKEQPRHIYVLLSYILVPIMMALTVVLLIWSATVIFNGVNASFEQLSSIATSYVIFGIWLHIMVAKHDSKIAKFYKTAYPFSAILILAFQAWALFKQVSEFGFKVSEYSFTMIWILAAISVILIIIYQSKAYKKIALVSIALLLIWVLPFVGYQDVTFNSQLNMLEKTLVDEELLMSGKILKADNQIDATARIIITNAVDFLDNSEKDTPSWMYTNLSDYKVFKDTLGFDKVYHVNDNSEQNYHTLELLNSPIDISDYFISLIINDYNEYSTSTEFEYENNNYQFTWTTDDNSTPKILVKENNEVIIEESLKDYLIDLNDKYPYDESENIVASLDDMSIVFEDDNISILAVFNSIDFYYDKQNDETTHHARLQGIYINFK